MSRSEVNEEKPTVEVFNFLRWIYIEPLTMIFMSSLKRNAKNEQEAWGNEEFQKKNKTARIRAKPWMFRLPFKFYGAVITIKN